jgi:hypothetical protein
MDYTRDGAGQSTFLTNIEGHTTKEKASNYEVWE